MPFKNRILTAGIISASLSTVLFASQTKADDKEGWYLTIGGGLAAVQDSEWDDRRGNTAYSGELQHDNGFSSELGVGYDYGRSSLEITWARNTGDLDAISVDQAGIAVAVSGGVTQDGVFVTGLYELTENFDSKITPYIGAGIGINKTEWDNITVAGSNVGGGWVSNFAGQLKVGTAVEMNETSDFYIEGVYSLQGGYTVDDFEYGSVDAWSIRAGLKFRM
ncbi:MAG: porin family protein [Prochlorococcus marinus CUG1435]|nr:porin family protein [Prochlorococcus marinus CUG1435]